MSGNLGNLVDAETSDTDEAERERTAVAATAPVEANQSSLDHDEMGSRIEIAAVVLLPGERSLFHHSLTDFARAHLIDSTVIAAFLDSATHCLWHAEIL